MTSEMLVRTMFFFSLIFSMEEILECLRMSHGWDSRVTSQVPWVGLQLINSNHNSRISEEN